MKKGNFKWLVVLCMTMGLVSVAKAQIYSSEACFYSRAGSSSVSYVVKFESSKVRIKYGDHSRENLSKSENFYETKWSEDRSSEYVYEYDYQKSTSSRVVYKKKASWGDCNIVSDNITPWTSHEFKFIWSHNGYEYVAFSKDKSSFIMWREEENDYDGKIQDRRDYTRVPKEDLLPKAANYDFLND